MVTKFGSTLARAMACCLSTPSHYQNQCLFIVGSSYVRLCTHRSLKSILWTFWMLSSWSGLQLSRSLLVTLCAMNPPVGQISSQSTRNGSHRISVQEPFNSLKPGRYGINFNNSISEHLKSLSSWTFFHDESTLVHVMLTMIYVAIWHH